jgi:putative ABC transport system substrate-binding protein
MQRREFLTLLGGAAAAWPLAARAQQDGRVRRVAVLMWLDENDTGAKADFSAFTQALAGMGWTEGRNVRIDVRWYGADNTDSNRMRTFAQELVGLQPDVILASGLTTIALQRQTQTIPIVFAGAGDPVARGIVARLNRPDGNITGFASLVEPSLAGKWLELLSEIAPGLKRAAIMGRPVIGDTQIFRPSLGTAFRSLKVEAIMAPVHSDEEIETAIVALGREPGSGLVVMPDLFLYEHRASIISAAARNNVPAIYNVPEFVREGGLLSYGSDVTDLFRRAASYVDRILRGAKPAELPVQLPIKYVMALNVKTAKALGLAVPPSIWVRADEVIE